MTFFFFKQKTAYEMRISDWSSDVCSSDLFLGHRSEQFAIAAAEPADGIGIERDLAHGGQRQVEDGVDGALGQRIDAADIHHLVVAELESVRDRTSVGEVKRVPVRVELGGSSILKHKKKQPTHRQTQYTHK